MKFSLNNQKNWARQVNPKDDKAKPSAPNSTNRHIGNFRSLYTDYFKHIGEK